MYAAGEIDAGRVGDFAAVEIDAAACAGAGAGGDFVAGDCAGAVVAQIVAVSTQNKCIQETSAPEVRTVGWIAKPEGKFSDAASSVMPVGLARTSILRKRCRAQAPHCDGASNIRTPKQGDPMIRNRNHVPGFFTLAVAAFWLSACAGQVPGAPTSSGGSGNTAGSSGSSSSGSSGGIGFDAGTLPIPDAGADAGSTGSPDAGAADTGSTGSFDAGNSDAGSTGSPDAGSADAGSTGSFDAGSADAGTVGPSDAGNADAGIISPPDAGSEDAGSDAGSSLPACTPPALGRGLAWVRANPMMIAGLDVVMPAPDGAAVSDYFDSFHATAVETWETGLPSQIAAYAAADNPSFRYVSWVDQDGTSVDTHTLLGGVAPLAGRIGYQIGDEPQNATDLQAILAGATAVAGADPDGLRIINLDDSSAADGLRAQAIDAANIDVLSYDHYTWKTSAADGLMATRTAALAAGKPYWRYIQSFYYKSDGPDADPTDLKWDALVGAVYGFTGYTWFVYSVQASSQDLAPLLFSVGGDFSAPKTALYAAAASANQELAILGRSLTQLTSTDVRYVAAIGLLRPSSLQDFSAGAGGDPYLSDVSLGGDVDALVGFFKDDCGEHYVMLQNQAHADGSFPNDTTRSQTFTLSFDFSRASDPSLDTGKVLALDTQTGAVAPRALTSTGSGTATLEVQLDPGAVFFFKYDDGRPFVGQP